MNTTFSHRHTAYVITNAIAPSAEAFPVLVGEYARTGWTHFISARRPKGTKEYMFHARLVNGEVVLTSEPF